MLRFMVFCESCQRWFHGECVGITTKDAEKIETFHCPKCREKDRVNLHFTHIEHCHTF